MAELKPCPFCGGTATISVRKVSSGQGTSDRSYRVSCASCGASTIEKIAYMQDDAVRSETVIGLWNSRVPSDPQEAEK